jgi:hypothetical protein
VQDCITPAFFARTAGLPTRRDFWAFFQAVVTEHSSQRLRGCRRDLTDVRQTDLQTKPSPWRNVMASTSKNSNRTNRKLTFQTLESRQLMAGDVTVAVLNGDLKITGDAKDNDVAVVQTMVQGHVVPGSYYVSGLNGTTINGASGGAYFTGVTRDFLMNLTQGGNDHLAMGTNGGYNPATTNANFIVPRNLSVSLDTVGNNNLELNGITVKNNASITAGAGDNTMDIRGNFGVKTKIQSLLPHGNLTIKAGGGDNHLELHNGSVLQSVNIQMGLGQTGYDSVSIVAMNVGRDLGIQSGGGGSDSNLIAVQGVHVGHDLNITGGIKGDLVFIGNTTVADRLFASLGHGEDSLNLQGVTAAITAVTGGQDTDKLHTQSDDHLGPQPQIQSFEQFV